MVQLAELLGESPGVAAVREQVRRLVQHAASGRRQPPVLIRGETGTGKGLLAQAIHHASPRARGAFVSVNCAAIPGALLEAELFGVEAGAFTDARERKPGLFQTAHRGTLFLDEIGALAHELQAKLLTAIEDRVVRRVGSVRGEPVDVWVISATSADLDAAMTAEGFRPDLYHRLATISLWLPPLRDRGGDVLQLAGEFLARACADYGRAQKRLAPEAQAAIAQYRWPGNVRELANVMERVALMIETAVVAADDLGLPGSHERPAADAGDTSSVPSGFTDSLHRFERAQLIAALEVTRWNVLQAAQKLGVPRTTLRHRMAKYRLAQNGEPLPAPTGRRDPAEGASQRPAPSPAAAREERAVTLLQARFERVTPGAMEAFIEKVEGFAGHLVEVDASGFLAAFGATPAEDAPARAARAALAVRTALAQVARDGASWPTASAGAVIALHAARAFMESPAGASSPPQITLSPDDPCRTVLEDLLAIAEQHPIRVSPTAARFLERGFTLAPLGAADRRAGSVLIGLEPSGLGLAGRPLSLLVGRQDELGMLRALLERAARGQGQVVGLIGEPGVGKSRLVYEFRESLTRPPVTYLEGHCLSSGTTTPYGPVLELIQQALGTSELDSSTVITDKVRQRLESLGIESETSRPYLLDLLGVKTAREQLDKLTPELVKRRTFETLRRVCLRLSSQGPVVLVVEDLHWIDPTSREFLASLIDPIASARILLLTTCRPGGDLPGLARSHGSQIAISQLSPRESLAIVRGIAAENRVPAALADAIVQKGAGNPFLLEELTWNVATDDGTSASVSVPDTIGEVLRARIDRLPPHDRGLLQAAAVVGNDVPFALLRSIGELSDHELRRGLSRLQAAEFLYEAHLSADLEYTFKHALTHEVTYSGLLHDRRRDLHARIVDAIETLHRDRLDEQIERLAHHALRGELREKAIGYLRQAGGRAAARSAPQEARGWFEQALGVLETLPESPSTLEQGFEIRLELRPVLVGLGEVRRTLERLREAEALAERLNDDRRRGRVCAFMTVIHSLLGELDEALVTGNRALGIAVRLWDLRLRIPATTYLAQAHYYRGEYGRVVELATDNLAALPADWVYEHFGNAAPASIYDRCLLIVCLAELGRFAEAVKYEAEAIRLAEPTHHAFTVGLVHLGADMLHLLKGDWLNARSLIEHGIAVARSGNVGLLLPSLVASSAWVLAQLGEASEALNRLRDGEQLLEREAARGIGIQRGWAYYALGRASLLLGRLDEARRLGDRVVESLPSQPGFVADALHLLGDITTHPDRFDAEGGEAHYRQALALAEPRGMRPLIAHCHLGLAKLHRRTGNGQQAQAHLATATTLYREMDMRFWLEPAEADLKDLA